MKKYTTHSPNETEAVAREVAELLRPGDVIAFEGGLGVGKTAFTRGLCQGLGIQADVSSPTFALVNEYRGKRTLYHFDMYRVETFDDLYSTGFFDYLDGEAILAIEWSENIYGALPPHVITISIAALGEETREITVEGDDRF